MCRVCMHGCACWDNYTAAPVATVAGLFQPCTKQHWWPQPFSLRSNSEAIFLWSHCKTLQEWRQKGGTTGGGGTWYPSTAMS